MNILHKLRNDAKLVWSLMNSGQKAALRTAYQNVQAALCLASLAFVSSAIGWLSGADIDLFGAIATLRAAVGAALLAAVASFRAYRMNRDGKGASYP
jgi:hypothetical protein